MAHTCVGSKKILGTKKKNPKDMDKMENPVYTVICKFYSIHYLPKTQNLPKKY